MCDSVTVSIAALTMGIRSSNFRVRQVAVSASEGITELCAGWRSTSSKVSPSGITSGIILLSFNRNSPVPPGLEMGRFRAPPVTSIVEGMEFVQAVGNE